MLYAYEIVVECICSMGLMTNVLLLFVVMKCPLNTFALAKYYFILVSVQNFIMVTCYLILAPTACPVILLYVPLLIMFLMLFTGWDLSPAMSFCCGILMSAYPLFSPIIIMFYMKDYRHYILHIFGLGKQAAAAARTMIVIAKDGKTTFTT
ncbi:hypothetical protein COOONC_06921 [Cooperia oncophora]